MGNRVSIIATEFIDKHDGSKSYGYRIFDDCGQTYHNSLSEETYALDDIEFLKFIYDNDYYDEIAASMFDFIREYETGISINGVWYPNEKISDILGE